jgi:hypothetical protein
MPAIEMEWVNVADGLPDDDTIVLMHIPGEAEPVWTGFLSSISGEWVDPDSMRLMKQPSHWMPLPEPPGA